MYIYIHMHCCQVALLESHMENVLDILQDNLDRLWRGETTLRNQIV